MKILESTFVIRKRSKILIKMFYSQGYTEYVLACNNGKINEFEDLKSLMNPEVRKECEEEIKLFPFMVFE